MKIAIFASEVVPYAKTGGLADVAGALPLALAQEGQEPAVVMPLYKAVDRAKSGLRKIKQDIWQAEPASGVKVYFIDNPPLYARDGLYGDGLADHKDNLERFVFYCRRSLELLKDIGFKPDILHAHDWQAALAPVYLKTIYAGDEFFKKSRSVLTIHNIGYQGLFSGEDFPKTGLPQALFGIEGLEFYGKVNLLKGGVEFADIINTVSRTYSREIQSAEFAFGLEGVLNKRKDALFGILNGLDYSIWDPASDRSIAANYSAADPAGKARCKRELQKLCRLPVENELPLIGIVSRLAEQKGFDILPGAIDAICGMGLQLVILGTGDLKYHNIMEELAKKYPEKISLFLKFDDALAHKIYAGGDIFLMPSRYEPCGLGQLISLRYGTIPLVFKTGGLADTVNSRNGFVFRQYSSEALASAVKKAVSAFKQRASWGALMQAAFKCDFSWQESAKQYIGLYERAKGK
jgi:starch synthase